MEGSHKRNVLDPVHFNKLGNSKPRPFRALQPEYRWPSSQSPLNVSFPPSHISLSLFLRSYLFSFPSSTTPDGTPKVVVCIQTRRQPVWTDGVATSQYSAVYIQKGAGHTATGGFWREKRIYEGEGKKI